MSPIPSAEIPLTSTYVTHGKPWPSAIQDGAIGCHETDLDDATYGLIDFDQIASLMSNDILIVNGEIFFARVDIRTDSEN